jgi:hypothetical protein
VPKALKSRVEPAHARLLAPASASEQQGSRGGDMDNEVLTADEEAAADENQEVLLGGH